jgi:chemotaxis protein methyltransferase WspC
MIFSEFEGLLKRTIGLDASSLGSSSIKRAVQGRMAACGLKDLHAYLEHVHISRTELQELVEAIVVRETWFFRDREAFAAMVRMAHEEWLPNHPQTVFRLLSLPCSSGEEPYSMAMALLDSGFPESRFRIDAVDISVRALALAERGIHGKNSFRGNELAFRERYFVPTKHGFQLNDPVRKCVRFKQGNIFEAGFLPGADAYDIIFCRNMLIYFDDDARERAVDVLSRLMTANGLLFVGPSEANLFLSREFISTKIPLAFAFRKSGAKRTAKQDVARRVHGHNQESQIGVPAPKSIEERAIKPYDAPSRPSMLERLSVDEIRCIADQGHLTEAARRCEEFLLGGEPSAEALHLLGLIRDAMGHLPEAADCYRKTLYLDPNHHQALIHLALLLDKQGDKSGAKVLNDRVRRLDRREGGEHA